MNDEAGTYDAESRARDKASLAEMRKQLVPAWLELILGAGAVVGGTVIAAKGVGRVHEQHNKAAAADKSHENATSVTEPAETPGATKSVGKNPPREAGIRGGRMRPTRRPGDKSHQRKPQS